MNTKATPVIPSPELIEAISCNCYEAYRGFGLACGEVDLNTWQIALDPNKESVRTSVSALLQRPETSAEELHNDWVKRRTAEGWRCGTYDAQRKCHAWLRPFSDLPAEQRMQWQLFVGVVQAWRANFPEKF